jgi:hypothetical protein
MLYTAGPQVAEARQRRRLMDDRVRLGAGNRLGSFYPQRFIISHVGATEPLAHADYKVRFTSPDDENRVVLEYA